MPPHAPPLLYIMSVLGAVALYLMMKPAASGTGGSTGRAGHVAGIILGLGVFAWLLKTCIDLFAPEGGSPEVLFLIFSVIALASSVRMITHSRPVYSALYFVMVVLSSAALFLLLGAEFMAFALIIVYAGAILITYMFVLMLAQQSDDPNRDTGDISSGAEYDRLPREPAMAAVMGFLMLALLGSMVYDGVADLKDAPNAQQAALRDLLQLNRMPRELDAIVASLVAEDGAEPVWRSSGEAVYAEGNKVFVDVAVPGRVHQQIELTPEYVPSNVQHVGLALVAKFPVSLELAGIILLLAMFGAAVLSRRQIELSEDELREAAGLHRMTALDDADHDESAGSGKSDRPSSSGQGGSR